MAEDPPKVPSPDLAQAIIPSVDGSTDLPSNTTAGQTSEPAPRPAQDGEGDSVMTSPTAPMTAASAPVSTLPSTTTGGPVPLDSPLRSTPIHPSLPSVKVPEAALTSSAPNTNPITLQPFTEAELTKHGFGKLRAQIFATAANSGGGLGEREKEEIARMREETAALLKQKLDEREARVREIEREMEEKEKIREVERKVFRKKLAGGKEM
ncbi:hypothetical protein CLAIMM_02551 [Cladophialophora immunda]|nr:hypothetical protein CLAIMM_02551 [Cladophialophora immunda]